MPVVYSYAGCSTCRRALSWLSREGIAHRVVDIVASPPSAATLRRAMTAGSLPLGKLFNTSGRSYREGGFKDRLKSMTEEQALETLAADGKLIKRPLLLGDGFALVGFRESEYAERLRA
jgi:arsenate reductase